MKLLTGGDDHRLNRAALAAHRTWELRLAEAAATRVHRDGRATWTWSGHDGLWPMIVMPDFAGRDGGARLDKVMRGYRSRRRPRNVGCWSPQRAVTCDLQAMFVARGFNWGGRGDAMACDLRKLRNAPRIKGVTVERCEDADQWTQHIHPYHMAGDSRERLAAIRLRYAAQASRPDRVALFLAHVEGKPVGAAAVSVFGGALGCAGIYDVGVLPDYRNRGIGRLVTHAACAQGKRWGARFAVLGASELGYPVYKRLGFRDLGPSWFWACTADVLRAKAPSSHDVRLAEAVIRGDLGTLETLWRDTDRECRLPCGLHLIDVAGRAKHRAVSQFLLDHKAAVSVLGLYDAGLHDEAAALMRKRPSLLNRRTENWGSTPLHQAIIRNDFALVRVMLEAGADPTIRDKSFGGDAMGWAHHFSRKRIAKMLGTFKRGKP